MMKKILDYYGELVKPEPKYQFFYNTNITL